MIPMRRSPFFFCLSLPAMTPRRGKGQASTLSNSKTNQIPPYKRICSARPWPLISRNGPLEPAHGGSCDWLRGPKSRNFGPKTSTTHFFRLSFIRVLRDEVRKRQEKKRRGVWFERVSLVGSDDLVLQDPWNFVLPLGPFSHTPLFIFIFAGHPLFPVGR